MHDGLARAIAVTAVEVFRARLAPRGIALRPEHIRGYVVDERGFRDPEALEQIGVHILAMLIEREARAMKQFRRPPRPRRPRRTIPPDVQLCLPFEPGRVAA